MIRRRWSFLLGWFLFGPQFVLAQQDHFEIRSFQLDGATLLDQQTLRQLLSVHTGSDRGMDDVLNAATDVRHAYTAAGYPMIQVFVPEQTIGSGEVKLRVVEGKIAKVLVAGNQQYETANIRGSLPMLREGAAVDTRALAAAIMLANENPAKQIAANFKSGTATGDIDARIDVTESRLSQVTTSLDNYGSLATGRTRLALAYQNANLYNLDHQVTLQYTTTTEHPGDVKNVVGSYHVPLYGAELGIDIVAAYSDSQSSTNAPVGQLLFSGKGSYVAIRFDQPLATSAELRQKISYGLDYKDFANRCAVAGIDLPAGCGSVTTQPLSIAYSTQWITPAVQVGGGISYAANLAGGQHGSTADYAAARSASSRYWDVLRFSGFVAVPLSGDWLLRSQVAGQTTGDALVPAEQYGLGGGLSIRGYEERVVSGDKGYTASVELYGPEFAKHIEAAAGMQMRALAFCDFGSVRRNKALPGEKVTTNLSSIGLGLRLNRGKDISARVDIGWIQQSAGSRQAHQAAGNFSVSYSF